MIGSMEEIEHLLEESEKPMAAMHDLKHTYAAGKVVRYHTNQGLSKLGQTTADHTWGMLALCYKLHPSPSARLIKAITFHDASEVFGGDLSYPFKRQHPDLAADHDIRSKGMARKAGIPIDTPLNKEELEWLSLLDRLECLFLVQGQSPDTLKEEAWKKMAHDCYQAGRKLDLREYHLEQIWRMTQA